MAHKILVTATNYSQLCSAAKSLLEKSDCEIIESPFGRPMTFEEIKDHIDDVEGVVAGVDDWNEEVFKIAPKLKVISRFGVGVDNIDIEAARKHGIQVTNAAGGNSNAVAELTIGLIISAMRNVPQLHATTREGQWDRFSGYEVINRTVGLLGFGNIARSIAKKLQGFDVNIVAYDKYPNMDAAKELNVSMMESDEVIAAADVLCMMLPSLPETQHFMNAETFAKMKDGSYFINTARGALVDEKALADALTSGKLRAAAIDVYEQEPTSPTNPLFNIPNIVTTPHTAAETYETYHSVGLITANAILDVFAGRTPKNIL